MKSNHDIIESEFREKLNEREIQPSFAAWDRLDAMLTVAEEQKPVRTINWHYIAAGFIGFLLMLTVLFHSFGKSNVPENKVATQNQEVTPPAHKIQQTEVNTVAIPSVSQESVAQNNSQHQTDKEDKKNNIPVQKDMERLAPQINESHEAIAQVTQQKEPSVTPNKTQVQNAPQVDVEQLLASVETTQKPQKQSLKIDANSLLSQVDNELELTFREKVFKSVKSNYKTVKVALANRNNK